MKMCSLCDDKHYAHGWCEKHYQRWRNNGDPLVTKIPVRGMTLREKFKFYSQSTKSAEGSCVVWSGGIHGSGYGRVEHNKKHLRAHVVAWELVNGSVPPGKQINHTCDNKLCVNILHLYLGTQQDNISDKVQRNRCASGESHGMSKLTEADVLEIRAAFTGKYGEQKLLADRYKVHRDTIKSVISRATWADL